MREYRFALGTVAATFVLLVIGGLVHPTGSSLACPDWPLCYGQFFPRMSGGILFEHGHRLAAATVAALTLTLAALVVRRRRERGLRLLAVGAVLLVAAQASLGAITVLYKLPLLVSTGHLATSMAFFTTLMVLAWRLRPAELAAAGPGPRALVGAAALLAYLQIVLGALVRHTGAAMACTARLPFCDGRLWPAAGPGQLNMLHRWAGVALALLVVAAAVRAAPAALRAGHGFRALLALAAPALVLVQLGLGLWTVASYVAVPVVTLHLAAGALLLADLVALFLSLAGRARVAPAAPADRLADLAPAAG